MVLFSFSIPDHIKKIQSGEKVQTTRIPRKPRANGKKPYSVGEKVQLYYRSRQKKSCSTCLKCYEVHPCEFLNSAAIVDRKNWNCPRYSNFFGESVITSIDHYWNKPIDTSFGYEFWMDCTLGHLDDEDKDRWAQLDGFPKGWDEANDFFLKSTDDEEWMYHDLDVIKWNGQQIARRVA